MLGARTPQTRSPALIRATTYTVRLGAYGGYNYQSAVLGIESDIEAANINGGFAAPAVGFTADKVLFYGTGGLAFADISHTLHQFDHRGSRSHRKSPYRLDRWRLR